MTQLVLNYDSKTGEITQRYWGSDLPKWATSPPPGSTITRTQTSRGRRRDLISTALDGLEPGVDYDPDTQRAVPVLCYDPDADEMYAEVEIQPRYPPPNE